MEMVQRITDWVSVDQTKGTGWSDSEWVPSCVVYDTLHETFIVERTKRITPRKFKQHKHE
jgi:hypothetical protein